MSSRLSFFRLRNIEYRDQAKMYFIRDGFNGGVSSVGIGFNAKWDINITDRFLACFNDSTYFLPLLESSHLKKRLASLHPKKAGIEGGESMSLASNGSEFFSDGLSFFLFHPSYC